MALAATRRTTKKDGGAIPHRGSLPVVAADILYQGAMVCRDAAGRLAPASDTAGLSRVTGVMRAEADNSAGGAGAINGEFDHGAFWFDNSGSSIAAANVRSLCYAVDDEAVALAGTGNRPIAGIILEVDATLGVCVLIGDYLGHGDTGSAGSTAGGSLNFHARGASTADVANLAAFVVTHDGVTYIAGERILLKNQAAPAENGIYVVGTVAGTAPLTRATDMDSNAELVANITVYIAEGTANADTAWTVTTNDAITIGTTGTTWASAPYGYATVVDTGSANAVGSSLQAARADHVHREHAKSVTYVMTADVPNLAAFVLLQDGVTGIEGEFVLLANQTTVAENGVYVIGTVAGTAPLTRVAWMPAAAILRGGYAVHVEEGTVFAASTWFIDTAGAITIGTTAHTWYPERATVSAVLVAGTVTLATIPVLSLTKTNVLCSRQVANTSTLTDGGYHATVAGATGLTAGTVGTCAIVIEACIAAGTINVADISTLHVTVVNR